MRFDVDVTGEAFDHVESLRQGTPHDPRFGVVIVIVACKFCTTAFKLTQRLRPVTQDARRVVVVVIVVVVVACRLLIALAVTVHSALVTASGRGVGGAYNTISSDICDEVVEMADAAAVRMAGWLADPADMGRWLEGRMSTGAATLGGAVNCLFFAG